MKTRYQKLCDIMRDTLSLMTIATLMKNKQNDLSHATIFANVSI